MNTNVFPCFYHIYATLISNGIDGDATDYPVEALKFLFGNEVAEMRKVIVIN